MSIVHQQAVATHPDFCWVHVTAWDRPDEVTHRGVTEETSTDSGLISITRVRTDFYEGDGWVQGDEGYEIVTDGQLQWYSDTVAQWVGGRIAPTR